MKIYWDGNSPRFNHPGRGESRWMSNLLELLRHAGHEVLDKSQIQLGAGCDLTITYADDGRCREDTSTKHLHCCYFPSQPAKEGGRIAADLESRGCANPWISFPYRKLQQTGNRDRDVFIPVCALDYLLPADLIPNVERQEVLFAPRQGFTAYGPTIANHLKESLRWLAAAQASHPFKLNLMCISPVNKPDSKIPCLEEIKSMFQGGDLEMHPTLPWDEYIKVVGRCRLSIHPYQYKQWGTFFSASMPDALSCKVVPSTEGKHNFIDPPLNTPPTTENIIRFFQDDEFYLKHHLAWEDIFKEHRVEPALQLFNDAMKKMGLDPQI